MPELLLELFSEEIPARMQRNAARDLERAVNDRLLDAGFMPEGVKAFATPRRLSLVATGIEPCQPDRNEEKKGPRVGAPDKAVEGFLKSAGLMSVDQCETRTDKKGAYYIAMIEEKGRDTSEIIAEMIPSIVHAFPWPKAMRWGVASGSDKSLKWVRPLKSVLCTFNDEVVDFEIGNIKSGDKTAGHRFMAPEEIQVRNFEAYYAALSSARVVLDSTARAEQISMEAKTLCDAQGLALIEDPGLLAEVAGLAEWPVVMIGSFDDKFLTVPDEALIASMRSHQKYFSVRDPNSGKLANKFVYVANIEAPDGGKAMREGYERVLTARLSDAWFLYQKDLEAPLESRIPALDRVAFFDGLGSVGDKARRVEALAQEIAAVVGADPELAAQAARLAKADLVTGMVYEFPELQGVMGRYYAVEQGVDRGVADAIRDHYKPAGQDETVPVAPVSVAVALAEKIDTLAGFWAIGKKPTGSKDPFALRRAALGVIRIVLHNKIRLKISESTVKPTLDGLKACGDAGGVFDISQLLSFFHDRLKIYLREQGHRHDHIDAVLCARDGTPEDDLVLVRHKLDALEGFLKTDDGANLVSGYKRAANILKAEAKKSNFESAVVDESRLLEAAEKKLYKSLLAAETITVTAIAEEKFEAAMNALSMLRSPIDAFFDGVIVNADDPTLRSNRLNLLSRFIDATTLACDLSKLEG